MEPSKKRESRQVNEEGELIGAVFCEYCGELNPADAAECEHCHEHIADQGPDLRSRLQRISRRASGLEAFSDIAGGVIGSVTGQPSPESHEGRSILSVPIQALRAGSLARLTELGAVLASVTFLIFMVAYLIVPSREMLPVIVFFLVAALSCTTVSIVINTQQSSADRRESNALQGSTSDPVAIPVRWDAARLVFHLGFLSLGDPRSLTVLATIILFGLVILIFGLILLPLAR
jgi:hypothetical protein